MKYLAPIIFLALIVTPSPARAVDYFETIDQVGNQVYADPEQDLGLVITTVIKAVLGIIGVLLFVITVYSGFLWMTAGGNTDQVTKAKAWIVNGVIGIAIILFAYVISSFIISALEESAAGTAGGAEAGEEAS